MDKDDLIWLLDSTADVLEGTYDACEYPGYSSDAAQQARLLRQVIETIRVGLSVDFRQERSCGN